MNLLLRSTDRYFSLSTSIQFVIWFALICIIKFDTVLAPPVWDTAMGVFPPAIFLYENNFNIMQLVQEPTWWQGGANVHSLSLWTWFIAAVMTLTGSPSATVFILHIFTFVLCAFAITLFVKTLWQICNKSNLSLLSGFLLLLTPLVLVQIGYIYTESLVMALSILVWVSWHNKRIGTALLCAVIAMLIKMTGLIIGLCILPLLLLRLIERFTLKRLLYFVTIPVCYFILSSLYDWLDGTVWPDNAWGSLAKIIDNLQMRLISSVDIVALIAISIISGVSYLAYQWIYHYRSNTLLSLYRYCVNNGSFWIVFFYPILFILAIIAVTLDQQFFLQRYVIPIIPFAIAQLVFVATSPRFKRILTITFACASLLSIYNYNGKLYRYTTTAERIKNTYSMVEISHAYKGFVLGQKKIIDEIEKLNDTTPIYVSREIDYMTSHPMMGYLGRKKTNINGFYKRELRSKKIADLPSEFYVARTNVGHGGRQINALLSSALTARDQGWQVKNLYWHEIDGRLMTLDKITRISDE